MGLLAALELGAVRSGDLDHFLQDSKGLPSGHEAVREFFQVTIITLGRERSPLLQNLPEGNPAKWRLETWPWVKSRA